MFESEILLFSLNPTLILDKYLIKLFTFFIFKIYELSFCEFLILFIWTFRL